jgi:molecular chaperone GrpE
MTKPSPDLEDDRAGESTVDFQPSSAGARDAAFAENATASDEKVASLEQQLTESMDRELKAQAELENFRKRVYRDTEQTVKYATSPLIRDLLEVLDNLSRASEAASSNPDAAGLLDGVKLVQQQFIGALGKHHCRPIEAVGKEFDPNFHQAIAQSPSDEYPAGQVMLEASVGYLLHDRVIRPSHVIVSTGKA